jgi:para-nitrobenzyl esterase
LDCLAVSVYVPPNTERSAPKPVIVYLHGGGFIMGSASYDLISPYPVSWVRDTDAILVQVQYRLGPAGFLALPEMSEEHGFAGRPGSTAEAGSPRSAQHLPDPPLCHRYSGAP